MRYNQGIIDFFKRHNMYDEKMFEYLQENSTMVDYKDPEQRPFIGCYYIQGKNNILQKIVLYVPYVYDNTTALIDIHEITHGIENYYKIGKKFEKNITVEALPLLYEKLYILENPTDELIEYGRYLDEKADRHREIQYRFALKIRDELLSNYNYNMKKMEKKVKKLSRKYHEN